MTWPGRLLTLTLPLRACSGATARPAYRYADPLRVSNVRTIAFVNLKGGSAKTTSCASIAAALAEQGERVLCIDLDAQGTLTRWLGHQPAAGLLATYLDGQALAPVATDWPGVDLVPADPELTERRLAAHALAVAALRRALARLDGPWSVCLLDCPPALGAIPLSALAAAGGVVIPVEAGAAALDGLPAILEAVRDVDDQLPPGPAILGILVCRVDRRLVLTREVVEALREHLGDLVLGAEIPETVRLREALAGRVSVLAHDPAGIGSEAYRSAAVEINTRWPT